MPILLEDHLQRYRLSIIIVGRLEEKGKATKGHLPNTCIIRYNGFDQSQNGGLHVYDKFKL